VDDADMEVTKHAQFDAGDLPPVLCCEQTVQGWRGLTADGVILNVNGNTIPDSLSIVQNGTAIGVRAVPRPANDGAIDRYLQHFDRASALMRSNQSVAALVEVDAALATASTTTARFNRGLILLQLGRWPEGFDEYQHCEYLSSFLRPLARTALDLGLRRWRGEDIAGKRLLLVHDHGFGDTIMMLRFVPQLKAMGADVVLMVPPELERLASQFGQVEGDMKEGDYFCSFLALLHVLRVTPDKICTAPYLRPDEKLIRKWRRTARGRKHNKIGIAWAVGQQYDGDYPRSLPLDLVTSSLGRTSGLISVQKQGGAEADRLGVKCFQFADFADCAALMSLLDEIVTIDTAALHLAGAIGHPRITALLSHWSSWRWLSPLYQNVQFCRQDAPGDWASALAKRCCR
jgi:hypothetical protein